MFPRAAITQGGGGKDQQVLGTQGESCELYKLCQTGGGAVASNPVSTKRASSHSGMLCAKPGLRHCTLQASLALYRPGVCSVRPILISLPTLLTRLLSSGCYDINRFLLKDK